MFIDSHCHINSADFDIDRENTVKRAHEMKVNYIVDVCDDIKDINRLIDFCGKHQNIYTSVGVHPELADKYINIKSQNFEQYTNSKYVIGIGECGLDYYYNSDIKEQQINVFVEHIRAAQNTNLPLIIHTRDADEDMQCILQDMYKEKPFAGEFHCFSSSEKLAEFALKIGFYLSASGIITFKKSEDIRNIFKNIPLNRLLIETDSPFLAPVPHRGSRNEPAYVVNTAEELAKVKCVSMEEIAEVTTSNFFRLFSKVKNDG